jgi:hypothetical protein
MRFAHYKLLRRTAILIGAASALVLGLPAAAQGTATLVGASGTTCTYSQMTVQPNGNISISCNNTSGNPTVGLSGPSTLTVGGPAGTYQITRNGDTAAITVNYSVTGGGCVNVPSTAVAIGASATSGSFTVSPGTLAGSCIVAITPPATYVANPSTVAVNVSGSVSGPPPPSGCPTPQAGYQLQTLGWSPNPLELRLDSGVIASFPIPAPNTSKVSVRMTQGQQQMSPGDGISEMSISKCPGVIDTTNTSCYSKTQNGNNYTVSPDAFTKGVYSFTSQTTLAYRGCWAPASEGQWYVNVRWTYANSCYGLACGYSMQWLPGAY